MVRISHLIYNNKTQFKNRDSIQMVMNHQMNAISFPFYGSANIHYK